MLNLNATVLPGSDLATGVDISADGSLVAVARAGPADDATILLFRADGSLVHQWDHDAYLGRGVRFVPGRDGAPVLYTAVEWADGVRLTRRDPATGAGVEIARYTRPRLVSSLAVSHDDGHLGVYGNFIEIRDLRSDAPIATIPPPAGTTALWMCFLPDRRSIVVHGHVEGHLVELSVPDLRELRRWPGPAGDGRVVTVSPDGGYLFAAGNGVYGQFLYRLADNACAFGEESVAALHAFVSPSHLLRVVGAGAAVFDLTDGGYLPVKFVDGHGRHPVRRGSREAGIAVAPAVNRVAVAWNNSEALVASLSFDGWPETAKLSLWGGPHTRSGPDDGSPPAVPVATPRPAGIIREALAGPGTLWGSAGYTVRGLLLRGDHADTPFPANPWGVPADADLAAALGHLWAHVAAHAPRFVATLRTRTLGLALVSDRDGVPFLGYLVWKWNDLGYEGDGAGIDFDLVGEGTDAYLSVVGGSMPRIADPDRIEPALAGPVPQPVRTLWAVHHGMRSSEGDLGGEVNRTLHEQLTNDGWDAATMAQSLGGHSADRLVEGTGSFRNHYCMLDLDRPDSTGTPTVADWSPEDRRVTNRGRFWDWLAWEACDLFFDGWIRDSTTARK